MDEVTQIEHMQSVALQPGDVIVLSMPHKISAQDEERVERMATNVFPGHKVIVMDGGMQMGVASKVDRLGAIEQKLDQLLASLAADEEEEPRFSLDGQPAGAERDGSQSLG
jgi:pyruvate kinase